MIPKRKSDGYDKNGKKKFKRFFLLEKNKCKQEVNIDTNKKEVMK